MGMIDGELVSVCSVLQMPMQKGKKRVHRLVVLPDYQGIGVGTKFLTEVAKLIVDEYLCEFLITTSTPALVGALKNNEHWVLARYGREIAVKDMTGIPKLKAIVSSSDRYTYSFWYKG